MEKSLWVNNNEEDSDNDDKDGNYKKKVLNNKIEVKENLLVKEEKVLVGDEDNIYLRNYQNKNLENFKENIYKEKVRVFLDFNLVSEILNQTIKKNKVVIDILVEEL